MGMDTLIATVYWLAPVMGLTRVFVSMAIEVWGMPFAYLCGCLRGLCGRLA